MFNKAKKEFQNGLTTFIKNQDPTLEQVILHDELSITLRNGAETLLKFLFSPENFEKVIDYALFDKPTETEEFGKLSIRQVNNNASHILSYPNDKVKDYISEKEEDGKPLLLQKLEDFIKDKKVSHDPYYIGHFERIYENILRYDKVFTIFFNDDFVNELIPYLAENILILPCKELFQILLDDFIGKISDDLVKEILNTMLRYATFFSYVTYCSSSSKNSLLESYKESIQYFKEMQPKNSGLQTLPIPDFELDDDDDVKKDKKTAKKKGKKFFPAEFSSKNIDEFDFEESQMKSYSFLSSIRIAFINNDHNELLEDENIIEMLLYCAVFSDAESLSSAEAFRILENMYYGVIGENDFMNQPQFYIEPFESDRFYELIDEYAEFIPFNNKYLNKQQVNAFPIFWNHKYKNLIDKEPLFINIDYHVLNMNNYYIYPEELTPFIAFRPLLLSDPPYSNQLTEKYIKVFEFLIRKKEKLIGNEKKDMKEIDEQTQDEIRQVIYIVYEFIQRKFKFYTKDNYLNYYDALFQMVPSFPHSMKEADNDPPKRPLLNGAICKVFEIIFNSSFFFINDKASLLLYDIEDETNTDVIQKIIEYNQRKPVLKNIVTQTKK